MPDIFSLQSKSAPDGEWVEVNPDDPFRVKVRPVTREYRDYLNRQARVVAREMNRALAPGADPYSADTIPPSRLDVITADAINKFLLVDVDGLTSGGRVVTVAEVKDFLARPEYINILLLIMGAIGNVTNARAEEVTDAVGN